MKGFFFLLFGLIAFPVQAGTSASERWCEELTKAVTGFGWKSLPTCNVKTWTFTHTSVEGRPLMMQVFGKEDSKNTTLIFSMVHADEVTPLYIALKLAEWLKNNPKELENTRVVLAPLTNPDSFFKQPRKRTNARGVDINRNLPTPDWNRDALKLWKTKYKADKRRFPGIHGASEPETKFQVDLINQYKPTKILSIHSPLNFLDYDGPDSLELDRFPTQYVKKSIDLRNKMKAKPHGYFPGSLGNYAGVMLGIPTLTLELPSANPRHAEKYWKLFENGIRTMIEFEISKE